jgi:hypothetical protein
MKVDIRLEEPSKNRTAVVVQPVSPSGSSIGRYEFEQLLQRAMEILNARDLAAQITCTFDSRRNRAA